MGWARAFPESFRKDIWLRRKKNCRGSLDPSAGVYMVRHMYSSFDTFFTEMC